MKYLRLFSILNTQVSFSIHCVRLRLRRYGRLAYANNWINLNSLPFAALRAACVDWISSAHLQWSNHGDNRRTRKFLLLGRCEWEEKRLAFIHKMKARVLLFVCMRGTICSVVRRAVGREKRLNIITSEHEATCKLYFGSLIFSDTRVCVLIEFYLFLSSLLFYLAWKLLRNLPILFLSWYIIL